MNAGNAANPQKIKKLREAVKPMLERGENNRQIADALNKRGLLSPQKNCLWTASSINQFCKHVKGLESEEDDGESLFQEDEQPSHIEDFFPYPNYGPMP